MKAAATTVCLFSSTRRFVFVFVCYFHGPARSRQVELFEKVFRFQSGRKEAAEPEVRGGSPAREGRNTHLRERERERESASGAS